MPLPVTLGDVSKKSWHHHFCDHLEIVLFSVKLRWLSRDIQGAPEVIPTLSPCLPQKHNRISETGEERVQLSEDLVTYLWCKIFMRLNVSLQKCMNTFWISFDYFLSFFLTFFLFLIINITISFLWLYYFKTQALLMKMKILPHFIKIKILILRTKEKKMPSFPKIRNLKYCAQKWKYSLFSKIIN